MKTFKVLLFILPCFLFFACENGENDDRKQFTVYSHLDSEEPTILKNIADLSDYIDLTIEIQNIEIAKAEYDWKGKGFIITPLKEGNTLVTIKEKDKIKYEIKVIVEYEGTGSWDIVKAERTIICDYDLKDLIEQDVLNLSPFYDIQRKSYYNFIAIGNGKAGFVDINSNKEYFDFNYAISMNEYVFSYPQNKEVKSAYKFSLLIKSDVGVAPQHKLGVFSIDRTKEYQNKFPCKNISKITEEYKVECWYEQF